MDSSTGPGHREHGRAVTVARATATGEDWPYGVRIDADGYPLRSDEPRGRGGADTGPAPFALLLAGLGACTAITLRMYAERKGWELTDVHVTLAYRMQGRDNQWIEREIAVRGAPDRAALDALAGIAERTPVTRAVRAGTEIRTTVRDAEPDGAPAPTHVTPER